MAAKDNKDFSDWRMRTLSDARHNHQEWTNGSWLIQYCAKNKVIWAEDKEGTIHKWDNMKERELKTPPIMKEDMGYIGDSDEEQEEGHKVDSEDEEVTGQDEEPMKAKVTVDAKKGKVVIDLTAEEDEELAPTQEL